jgi:hypothetical protein
VLATVSSVRVRVRIRVRVRVSINAAAASSNYTLQEHNPADVSKKAR